MNGVLVIIDNLFQIELEVTSNCNAACPQCVRNYYGSYTWPNLPIVDMDPELLKTSISLNIWKNLQHLRLCGTYGEPCMHPKLLDIIRYIKSVSTTSITINTNGGIRSKKWWQELAEILDPKKDTVVFGIDGLEDTSPLYRINVDYKKTIENLKAFNQAGGQSVWQYLVFKHNEHQVEQARELALSIGCSDFAYKLTSRFVDKTHTLKDQTPVLDKDGNTIYYIEPPTLPKYKNKGYDDLLETVELYDGYDNYLTTTKISCFAKRMQMIDIKAYGDVYPCAWIGDRMYGYEPEKHKDHYFLNNLINSIGGKEKINLNFTNLEDIINGPWFQAIEDSWKTNSIERCAHQCGARGNLIKIANENQFQSFVEPEKK